MPPRPFSSGAVRALRSIARQASLTGPTTQPTHALISARLIASSTCSHSALGLTRPFHLSATFRKGISPESADPEPKSLPEDRHIAKPAPISTEDYHKIADEFIEGLVHKLEQMQEDKGDMDCEYSVCPIPAYYNSFRDGADIFNAF